MDPLAALRAGRDPATAAPWVEARLAALRARLWTVPAWRARLRACGGSPDDLRTLADLAAVPPIDRDAWREAFADLVADPADPTLTVTRSSGSTAAPARVWRDPGDRAYPYAVMRFAAEARGRPLPRPFAVWFVDRLPGAGGRAEARHADGGPLWRSGPDDDLRDPPAADVISTDPAGIAALLDVPVAAPTLVYSAATALSPALRTAGEAHLAPIVDVYAATEVGPIAITCPAGRRHVLVPDVHVDRVDGELVVTRLRDSAQPVLRWRSGDRGDVRVVACACGATGPVIEGFTGRAWVPFVRPDGSTIDAWTLSPALRRVEITAIVVRQLAPDRFEVGAAGDLPGALAALDARLRGLGWAAPRLTPGPPPDGAAKVPFVAMP